MKKKRPIGRPPKRIKEINPVRQVGRWTDADWLIVRKAAEHQGQNVAEFAKETLLRRAKRILKG